MSASEPTRRTRTRLTPRPESLESRRLLTGSAGDMFAEIPAEVSGGGGTAAVRFNLEPDQFIRPRGSLTLGIDTSAQPGSHVIPKIVSVTDDRGRPLRLTRGIYDSRLRQGALKGKTATSAVLVTIPSNSHRGPGPVQAETVHVQAQGSAGGRLLLGFYLPGDANGDGVVNHDDFVVIHAALGSRVGDKRYDLDADVNRDGRITPRDMLLARRNEGVATTILPTISVMHDPSAIADPRRRITHDASLVYSGTTTPGASVTFDAIGGGAQPRTAVADGLGHYAVVEPLSAGVNSFVVTSTDAFGQVISGPTMPIVYQPQS